MVQKAWILLQSAQKLQAHRQLNVDFVPQAYNFVKKETPIQAFPC